MECPQLRCNAMIASLVHLWTIMTVSGVEDCSALLLRNACSEEGGHCDALHEKYRM